MSEAPILNSVGGISLSDLMGEPRTFQIDLDGGKKLTGEYRPNFVTEQVALDYAAFIEQAKGTETGFDILAKQAAMAADMLDGVVVSWNVDLPVGRESFRKLPIPVLTRLLSVVMFGTQPDPKASETSAENSEGS